MENNLEKNVFFEGIIINELLETVLNLSNDILMPYNRCFFHGLSVTMEPHCALNTVKKSLDSMPNNSH